MDKILKDRWLAALRSGNWKKGKGYLKVRDSEGNCAYCCLGVLADIIDPKGWTASKFKETALANTTVSRYRGPAGLSYSYLADHILPYILQRELAVKNDNTWANFLEAADYIEANVPVEEDR